MKNFNLLSKMCSPLVGSQSSEVGFECRLTVGSPSLDCRSAMLKLVSVLAILLTIGVGQMWGTVTSTYTFSTADNGKTITNNSVQWGLGASSVATNGTSLYLGGTITITMPTGAYLYSAKINKSSNWAVANKVTVLLKSGSTTLRTYSVSNYSSAFTLTSNQTDGSYTIERGLTTNKAWITSIQLVYYPQTVVTLDKNGGDDDGQAKCTFNATSCSSFTAATRAGYTCKGYYTATSAGTKVLNADGSKASNSVSGWWSSNKWCKDAASATLYAQWEAAASCEANPTIENASLNGSISLSSIPLSISSVGGGTDCTLAEYGFVWKASSAPSASDNKTKIGDSSSATSFTGNITGSFSTGVTYYIKGYAINNGPNTTLSSTALTITPQSVTFNSNGGSSVSTAYVNNGATVSKPSNPTKTGYTFGTWQLSGSDYNFSTTVTGDITLNATWNAKTTAITLNKNNDDASGSSAGSVNYTYGESTKDSYSPATRAGYTLNGYYTATSAGTKILNADGTIAGNSIVVSTVNYTDASGNWAYDGTSLTLYAQWTIKSYSVTWKVNNTDYTTGTPTSSVNHGSKVTKLPTAPDPESYCGDKFMGWTDATDGAYVHGTSNLYTSASQFPAAEGAQTFYAVFADYDD